MDKNNITLDLITNIPLILQYFVPGFFAMTIFTYLCSKKLHTNFFILLSCSISYTLIALYQVIHKSLGFNGTLTNPFPATLFSTVIAILCALGFSKIFLSDRFKSWLSENFHKSPHDDIWRNVLDLNKGSNLNIYIRNKNYFVMGHYNGIEEKGTESFIAISGYIKIHKSTRTCLATEPSYPGDKSKIFIICLKDIEYLELS